MESADNRELELEEVAIVIALGQDVHQVLVSDGGMDADGNVKLLGGLVEREKVGIDELAVTLDAANEYRAGAMIAGPAELLGGFVHGHKRQHGGPTEPVALLPGVR